MQPGTAERPSIQLVPVDRLLAHEQILQPRVDELVKVLRREGVIRLAIVADQRTLVVLDGHHRLAALKALGAKRIPVLLVDYQAPDIRVGTWREGERAPTKDEVIKQAEQRRLYPPKSTRHFFPWKLVEEPVPLAKLQ
jgi:L-serine kinase (ADP)